MGSLRVSRPLAPGQAAAVPERSANTSRLSRRLLFLARAVWIVIALAAISLFTAGILAEFALFQTPCPAPECTTGQLSGVGFRALQDLGLPSGFYATYAVVLDVVFAAVYGGVAILIFWRKSQERMALFGSLALLLFGTVTFPDTTDLLAMEYRAWEVPGALLNFLGSASFGLFLYLFPDGRFVPRWTRWMALV
jgi:hypothetical protein